MMKLITEDWKYKLLALAIAFSLWGYVSSQRNPNTQQRYNIPVELRNIQPGCNVELSSNQVSVIVKGPKLVLDRINEENLKAWVDLNSIKDTTETNRTIKVNVDTDIKLKKKVFLSAIPKNIEIKVTPMNTKYMSIDLHYLSPVQAGYRYDKKSQSDTTVLVTGPVERINKIVKVVANVPDVPITGYEGYIELNAYDKNNRLVPDISLDPNAINVKVTLKEEQIQKQMLINPILVGEIKYPLMVKDVSVSPNEILVSGTSAILKDMNVIKTEIISIDDLTTTTTKKVKCILPDNVKAVSGDTVDVTIVIENE